MTRRITCYVVFATIIWSAHTQNEEKVRDDMFKSNMTRNDFSKLLSSLIKLNEQRVSVLQRLYKLEDYGVLSEVLRSGSRKPENGSPNNLFLIVMSKNETAPSRRQFDFGIVDSVKSLDVGSKEVHPKLDYVLDPASFISQETNKETSIFGNIPKVHGPKKTYLINDGSKKNINIIKPLKHRKPSQNANKRDDTNILRNKKKGQRTTKKMRNRYENSKLAILSNEGNGSTSQELQDYNENSKEKSSVSYDDPPYYTAIYVTKIIETKQSSKNNPLEAKDRRGRNGYGSLLKKEFSNNSTGQDTKTDSDNSIKKSNVNRNKSILNNQDSNYKIIKTDIKSTTNKYDPNRKYTKMNSDISIKKVNDDKNLKHEINSGSPKISVQEHQNAQFNRSKYMLNPGNMYSTAITEIKNTIKDDLRIIVTLNNSKTHISHNYNNNSKFFLPHEDLEDENYYGSPFSKEYDGINQNRTNIKIDLNNSVKQNLNKNVKKSKIKDKHASTVKGHSDKFPPQAIKNPPDKKIPVIVKVLPYKNDDDYTKDVGNYTNKYNSKMARDFLDGVNFGDKGSKNTTNRDNKNSLSRVMAVGNIDRLTITTDPSLHLKDITENIKKDKMKTAKDLDNGNKKEVESKQQKDLESKKNFDESGELIVDKKNGEDFSIIITHVKKNKLDEDKPPTDLRIEPKDINQPGDKPIERKGFQTCLNKKAKKLCSKSCISAYKNVCYRLKCTSKAKKALKKECKRSCKKTFASSSSKYSDESHSDDSYSDDSYSYDSSSDVDSDYS